MRYFYIFPFKRQYYFPEAIKDYPFLKSFFKPYSKIGFVFWWLWNTLPFFKYLFTTKEENITDSILDIKENFDSTIILAYNTGTIGYTQKITALGFDKKNSRKIFFKYANKKITKELTEHESSILNKIKNYECSPKVILAKNTEKYAILVTDYIEGIKLDNKSLDDKIFKLILKISQIKVVTITQGSKKDLKYCFGHGDFCPWNLLETDYKIIPIDWEFAQNYPLGFDMFTYIFQSEFLITPNKEITEIVLENESFIKQYFLKWNIENWYPYLREFSSLKLKRGDIRESSHLYNSLVKLRLYAEKA